MPKVPVNMQFQRNLNTRGFGCERKVEERKVGQITVFMHEGESLKYLINNIADLGFGKWFVAVFTVLVPLVRNVEGHGRVAQSR